MQQDAISGRIDDDHVRVREPVSAGRDVDTNALMRDRGFPVTL